MSIKTGEVKRWLDQKGFGFILPDDGGPEVFVHQSGISSEGYRSLAEGEKVEFEMTTENGKEKAINVTGPNGAPVRGSSGGRGGGGGRGGRGGGRGDYGDRGDRSGGGGGRGGFGGGRGGGRSGGGGRGEGGCFNCGESGHFARECPQGGGGGGDRRGGSSSGGSGGSKSYGSDRRDNRHNPY